MNLDKNIDTTITTATVVARIEKVATAHARIATTSTYTHTQTHRLQVTYNVIAYNHVFGGGGGCWAQQLDDLVLKRRR